MPIDAKKIVEIKNLFFGFGSENVLDDVSLEINRGDYLGVIGPNGSGKTTLLRLMLGLIKPKSGTIKLFGQNLENFKHWDKIGYVPQKAFNFDVTFPATVEEVVSMGRFGQKEIFERLNSIDRKITQDALEQVGMAAFANRLIGKLSSGQQQRVFIGRALASKPEILFLDEPTVGIDIEAQEQFYDLLRDLNSKLNLTLVLVSHDIDVVANEVSQIACINKNLVYHGSPKQFIKDDYLKKLYGKNLKFILHGH